MRTNLAKLGSHSRFPFQGRFARYGYKRDVDRRGNEHFSPTLLLTDVQVQQENKWKPVTDHLWFNLTKGFSKLGLLNQNDLVLFNGRINDYYKGYFNQPRQHDLKLSYPTKIKYADNTKKIIPLPEDKNAIVGLIMNLEWDFYTKNNRPVDDYCLNQFKNSAENKKYDYGITVHNVSEFINAYDFNDDYNNWAEQDDWKKDDFEEEVQQQIDQQQRRYNRRLELGQSWLKQHKSVKPELQKIIINITDKRIRSNQVLRIIKRSSTEDLSDEQLRQIKNAVITLIKNNRTDLT